MGINLGDLARSKIVFGGGTTLLAAAAFMTTVDQWRSAEFLLLLAGSWVWLWLWYRPYISTRHDTAVIAGSALAVFIFCHVIEDYRQTRILALNNGLLLPADDLSPPTRCTNFTPDYRVFLFGSVGMATNVFPHDIIRTHDSVLNRDVSLMSIDLINGSLAISATIEGADRRSIAVLEKNKWKVNPNNIMSKNPDFSTLIVYDQLNERALYVRYMNSQTIKVSAILRHEGRRIEIDDQGIKPNRQGIIEIGCIVDMNARGAFIRY